MSEGSLGRFATVNETWSFLQDALEIKEPKPRKPHHSKIDGVASDLLPKQAIGLRSRPPHYVRAIVGGEPEPPRPNPGEPRRCAGHPRRW